MAKKLIIPIIIFLIGLAINIIGALIKILHWEYQSINGSVLLTIGSFIEVIAIFNAIVKLIQIYKTNK